MSKKIQRLSFDLNQDYIKIKQETNTIRLIASDAILKKLDLLDLAYEKSFDESSKMMNNLPVLMAKNDQDKMKKDQHDIEISAQVINLVKDEIIKLKLMRTELNEI